MSVNNNAIRAHLTPAYQLPRVRAEQERVLESNFQQNRNPTDLDVTLIAAEAGLSEENVKVS